MRPWKEEQLGGGYAVSSFCERTALEAADAHHRRLARAGARLLACYPAIDPARVSVIYNGIDSEQYAPDPRTDVLARHGIDPARPSVVFVGRITRQKGVTYALDAALQFDPGAQVVLCAGAPDTPEIAAEIEAKVERVRSERGDHHLDRRDAPARRRGADPEPRDRLPVPVDLRAARHRQPRGDGLRDGGRRDAHRRHPRGRRRRGDGPARPVRAARRRLPRPRRPDALRPRHRRARQRPGGRSPAGAGEWARPAGGAPSSTSPGRRSPSRRSRSTGSWRRAAADGLALAG